MSIFISYHQMFFVHFLESLICVKYATIKSLLVRVWKKIFFLQNNKNQVSWKILFGVRLVASLKKNPENPENSKFVFILKNIECEQWQQFSFKGQK